MNYRWVIGRYSIDGQGSYVLGMANAGIGYILINRDRQKKDDVIVGFKFAGNEPLPNHLDEATPFQIEKLERVDKKRQGVIEIKYQSTAKSITDIFGGGSYYKLKEASQGSEL